MHSSEGHRDPSHGPPAGRPHSTASSNASEATLPDYVPRQAGDDFRQSDVLQEPPPTPSRLERTMTRVRKLSGLTRSQSHSSAPARPSILKRALSAFYRPKIAVDDIRSVADLRVYRKQCPGGQIDTRALTPAQRLLIGAILWAEMQAHPEQLQRVKRENPGATDAEIKRACGIPDMTEQMLASAEGADATSPGGFGLGAIARSISDQSSAAASSTATMTSTIPLMRRVT